jgi:DNA-binding IclR family transcriptional regulator
MPRATCDAVLLALSDGGLVVRRVDRLYELGPRCISLGDAARAANSMLEIAASAVDDLARRMGSCVAVSVADGNETRVADVADYSPPFAITIRVGQAVPMRPPFGAVFVAWADHERIERWLDEPSIDESARVRYRSALADVRRRGFSVTVNTDRDLPGLLEAFSQGAGDDEARPSAEELFEEMVRSHHLPSHLDDNLSMRINQLSAPIFGSDRSVVASIMILGPNREMPGAEIDALGELVVSTADDVTRSIGGRRPVGEPWLDHR